MKTVKSLNTQRQSILVVDDDVDILDSLHLVLEDEGYSVVTSEKGEYAENIRSKAKRLPDLIILDVFLSGNDGREIAKKLKHDDETKKIPILMISANPSAHKSTLDAGANFFLPKPFALAELLAAVEKLLKTNTLS